MFSLKSIALLYFKSDIIEILATTKAQVVVPPLTRVLGAALESSVSEARCSIRCWVANSPAPPKEEEMILRLQHLLKKTWPKNSSAKALPTVDGCEEFHTESRNLYLSKNICRLFTHAFHSHAPNSDSLWTEVAARTLDKVQIELCQFYLGAFGARDKKESMFHLYC